MHASDTAGDDGMIVNCINNGLININQRKRLWCPFLPCDCKRKLVNRAINVNSSNEKDDEIHRQINVESTVESNHHRLDIDVRWTNDRQMLNDSPIATALQSIDDSPIPFISEKSTAFDDISCDNNFIFDGYNDDSNWSMMLQQSTTLISDDDNTQQEYSPMTFASSTDSSPFQQYSPTPFESSTDSSPYQQSPIDSPLPESVIDLCVQFDQTTSTAHPSPIDQQFAQTLHSFIDQHHNDQVTYYNNDANNQQRFSINDDADHQAKLQIQIELNRKLAFRLSPHRKLDKHRLFHSTQRCHRSKSEQSIGAKKKRRTNNKYNNQQYLVNNTSSASTNSADEYNDYLRQIYNRQIKL